MGNSRNRKIRELYYKCHYRENIHKPRNSCALMIKYLLIIDPFDLFRA